MNLSTVVGTSKVRVLTFGLSPVIRLGLRNPKKKKKKKKGPNVSIMDAGNAGKRTFRYLPLKLLEESKPLVSVLNSQRNLNSSISRLSSSQMRAKFKKDADNAAQVSLLQAFFPFFC